ncbi:MAG TPA: protein kinase, partial [Vineibacter sp.]|nr:protein kinase [Vineibacter sp.]
MAAFLGEVMASDQPSIVSPKRTPNRTPPQTLTPGARVGRYQVSKVLRLGRAGITYRARDTACGRDVALKEYLPVDIAARRSDLSVLPRQLQHVDDFVWGRDRFVDEARALAALAAAATPGIVGVDDALEANGTAYIVTALPARETLASWLMREGPLAPDRLARLLVPLLDGLAQAHAAGVLHLDIKPTNIALDDQGFARLFDFGGARAALAARLPSSSAMPATAYTAIEQSTFRAVGPFTDVYGLAATLYECIGGIAPPPAIKRPAERLAAVPRKAAKAHGPRLLSAIQAGLALEPAERPASIAAWRPMLDEALAAVGVGMPLRSAATSPAGMPSQPPRPTAPLDAFPVLAFAPPFAPPTASAVVPPSVPPRVHSPVETLAVPRGSVHVTPATPPFTSPPAATPAPMGDSTPMAPAHPHDRAQTLAASLDSVRATPAAPPAPIVDSTPVAPPAVSAHIHNRGETLAASLDSVRATPAALPSTSPPATTPAPMVDSAPVAPPAVRAHVHDQSETPTASLDSVRARPAAPLSTNPPAATPVPTVDSIPVAPPLAELPAAMGDRPSASPDAPLFVSVPMQATTLVFDYASPAPPPLADAGPRTVAPATTAVPSSSVVTDAAMAASLRAIADAVAAAGPATAAPPGAALKRPPAVPSVPKTATAGQVAPVHADPLARPSALAPNGRPAAAAAPRGSRPWERWKIALTATLAFATIPAGVAGYYVALPPSPTAPPIVTPAADRLRAPSGTPAAAEASRRAQAEADAARRRAQEQADAEARRTAAAQAEAAARQAEAEAE